MKTNQNDVITNQLNADRKRGFISNNQNFDYCSNEIKSTSSNFITFVPLNLIRQLQNLANIYFIIVAILQMIPSISITKGFPTVLIPLAFVMLAVLLKDAYEQFNRYLKDKQENQRQVQVLEDSRFVYRKWQSLRVGEIIKVKKDQLIPCDAVIIATSDLQNRAFIQTKGLDGETNLKIKHSFLVNAANKYPINNKSYIQSYRFECNEPNPYLNYFSGFVQLVDKQIIPLQTSYLILRGCTLRNVHEAIAVCVYSGSDTKVVLNSAKFYPKKSKLMIQVNKLIIDIFILQAIFCLICSLLNTMIEGSYPDITKYFPSSHFILTAMTWWLMMTYFVPISLIVAMEIVKLLQGKVLERDREGYSQLYECFTSANNTSVNQNLGQIKFVFTDKTGTLTKNNMVFRHLICGGQLYGQRNEEKQNQNQKQLSSPFEKDQMKKSVHCRDKRLLSKNKKIEDAFRIITLCHDIYVQKENDKVIYNSSSPDEIALINFAKVYGFQLMGERNKFIQVTENINGRKNLIKYEKLAFLQFNSDRKRMSVIIKNPTNNKIQIYSKGADSTIQKLLIPQQKDLIKTKKLIDELSSTGLRTLMLGKRVITQNEYNKWIKQFINAKSIINEEQKRKALDACYQSIERDLELIGATAIEDQLQQEVMETIRDMRLAGMHFFILTGDKRETAISIGRSCGLIDKQAKIIEIPQFQINQQKQWRIQMQDVMHQTGQSIYLLNAEGTIPDELPLHQTICYRCTPLNKQKIVKQVKKHTHYLTMAVGDGANDVNMLTAADVGIGIRGKEGSEATRIADYATGEFKFIRLLTLYYGREWYRKNTHLVLYNFFKNWYHVSSILTFGAFSYFSGVLIFNVYIYQLYNIYFTLLPIIVYAVLDQKYNLKDSIESPELYTPGIQNQLFDQTVFRKNMAFSIIYGITSLLMVFYLMQAEMISNEGFTSDLILDGIVLFGIIVIIMNFKVLVMSNGIRPLNILFVPLSIILYWLSYVILRKLFKTSEAVNSLKIWSYPVPIFIGVILIFLQVFIEEGYRKYYQFKLKYEKAKQIHQRIKLIGEMMNLLPSQV